MVATHADVCQFGDEELKGNQGLETFDWRFDSGKSTNQCVQG
jgi:hypothetical protein